VVRFIIKDLKQGKGEGGRSTQTSKWGCDELGTNLELNKVGGDSSGFHKGGGDQGIDG